MLSLLRILALAFHLIDTPLALPDEMLLISLYGQFKAVCLPGTGGNFLFLHFHNPSILFPSTFLSSVCNFYMTYLILPYVMVICVFVFLYLICKFVDYRKYVLTILKNLSWYPLHITRVWFMFIKLNSNREGKELIVEAVICYLFRIEIK